MGNNGHWDRPAPQRQPRPADYELGFPEQKADVHTESRAAKLREHLLASTNVIGRDESWGPARRRKGVATKDEYDDLFYLLQDPTESGNAD